MMADSYKIMKKKDLLAEIQGALGGTATRGAAEMALGAVLRAVRAGLLEDGEVKLAGFGSFRMRQAAPRRVLLPGGEDSMILPRREVVRFTPAPQVAMSHKYASRTQKRLSSSGQMGDDTQREDALV